MTATSSIFLLPSFKCVIKIFSLAVTLIKITITLEYVGL